MLYNILGATEPAEHVPGSEIPSGAMFAITAQLGPTSVEESLEQSVDIRD